MVNELSSERFNVRRAWSISAGEGSFSSVPFSMDSRIIHSEEPAWRKMTRRGSPGIPTNVSFLLFAGLVLVFPAFLFEAFDEVLMHGGVQFLQVGFVQVVYPNQEDHVPEVVV